MKNMGIIYIASRSSVARSDGGSAGLSPVDVGSIPAPATRYCRADPGNQRRGTDVTLLGAPIPRLG